MGLSFILAIFTSAYKNIPKTVAIQILLCIIYIVFINIFDKHLEFLIMKIEQKQQSNIFNLNAVLSQNDTRFSFHNFFKKKDHYFVENNSPFVI
ncbi:hypothetical protein CI105_01925 [Candidatus Izimaplasma bacterium ZiA1]|nr:hypothetical protein CI105_01925 [Candidatus Izimaplasma bacterium ZiA1]